MAMAIWKEIVASTSYIYYFIPLSFSLHSEFLATVFKKFVWSFNASINLELHDCLIPNWVATSENSEFSNSSSIIWQKVLVSLESTIYFF